MLLNTDNGTPMPQVSFVESLSSFSPLYACAMSLIIKGN